MALNLQFQLPQFNYSTQKDEKDEKNTFIEYLKQYIGSLPQNYLHKKRPSILVIDDIIYYCKLYEELKKMDKPIIWTPNTRVSPRIASSNIYKCSMILQQLEVGQFKSIIYNNFRVYEPNFFKEKKYFNFYEGRSAQNDLITKANDLET